MKENRPSKTAQYMALFRAIESSGGWNRLFDDPLAWAFLSAPQRALASASALPLIRPLLLRYVHHRAPGAFSSAVARTRYIDDLLQRTLRAGVKQVVILGAGFDTRAMRLEALANIPVIEVDHPDTAREKSNRIAAMGRASSNVTYLRHDFNRQPLDDILSDHRIDPQLPTTILCEGVTNYLTPQAVDCVLRLVHRFAWGSYLLFTYVDRAVLDRPADFVGTEKLFRRLRNSDEQWTFGFEPAALGDHLASMGLELQEDNGAGEYRRMYMRPTSFLLQGYEFYHVCLAQSRGRRASAD